MISTITNGKGSTLTFSSWGASLMAWDFVGHNCSRSVVLGYADEAYYGPKNIVASLGATVGRYANRIGRGRFSIDGVEYQLPSCTQDGNHIHGGPTGFVSQGWSVEEGPNWVSYHLISPDGHEGYPGTLTVTVIYTIDDDHRLTIDYRYSSDKATICNLTNHSYFNLGIGETIEGHRVQISADQYLEADSFKLPTGRMLKVDGTKMDFRTPQTIEPELVADVGRGYDHCLVIAEDKLSEPRQIAQLWSPDGKLTMTVGSDLPGVQWYTGQYLPHGSDKIAYAGLCLETQFFPDSPNHPDFPSTTVEGGKAYATTTWYQLHEEKK